MKIAAAILALLVALSFPPKVSPEPSAKIQPTTLQQERWHRAQVTKHKRHAVDRIVAKIVSTKPRYRSVSAETGVPWWAIAAIHNMEASLSFSRHLHEGSPLTKRTRYVPKGRPPAGKPPFTWEESAKDALRYDRMDKVRWTEVDNALYRMEAYNGTGYLRYHKDVPSPYLWSYTNLYTKGKYVADGKWSSTAVSKQCGVVPIWLSLLDSDFPDNFHQLRP